MKTILQLKKLLIIPLLFLVGNVWGQITYSGSPTTAGGASCPSTNVTSGVSGTCSSATTFVGNTIKAYVSSPVSGTNATINLVKCDGTPFGSGTYFLKTNDICGTVIATGSVSGSNVPINISVSHSGTQNYRITFTATNGTNFYSNNISIVSTSSSPNLVCGTETFTPTTPIQGQNFAVSIPITNNGGTIYNGNLKMWLKNASTNLEIGTPVNSLNAGTTHTFSHTFTPLTYPAGLYVINIEKPDGVVVCSKNVTITSSQANLICGNAKTTPFNPVQGQSAVFSYTISNNGAATYNGNLALWLRGTNTNLPLGTMINSLNSNTSFTFTHTNNPIAVLPGNYNLNIEKPDGTIVCAKTITVIAQAATLNCGNATVLPIAPVVGQNASFTFSIKNNGASTYTGQLKMALKNSSQNIALGNTITILNAGQTHLFSHTVPQLTATAGAWQLVVLDATNTTICSQNITVIAAPANPLTVCIGSLCTVQSVLLAPCSVLSIVENNNRVFDAILYPNPSKGLFNLEINSKNSLENLKVQIFDLRGVMVYQNNFENRNLKFIENTDVSNLSTGVYILNLSSNENIKTLKLIINK